MKITLPRLLSVALPLGAFSSLALARQSDERLVPAYPPGSGRTAAATAAPGTGSTQPLIATCLPAIKDQTGGGCIQASSVPTLGDLLPLSTLFHVTPVGDVGVGTTAPAAKLHVTGTSRMGGRMTVTGTAPIGQAGSGIWINGNDNGPLFPPGSNELGIRMFNNSIAPGQSTIQAWNYGTNVGRDLVINDAGGNVGVGTSSPTAKLHVAGTSTLGGRVTVTGTAPIGQAGSGLWINGNDNGPLFPPGSNELGIRLFNNSIAPGQSTIQAWNYGSNSGRDLVINDAGGNVGVGNSSPAEKLDVAGNIRLRTQDRIYFGSPTDNGDPIYIYRQNGAFEESTVGFQLGNDSSGIDRFEIFDGDGLLMRVWGTGLCQNTTGSWTVLSDRRLKKNIEPLQGALAKLLELQGVHYEYNEKAEAGSPAGVRTGFIAQDVEQVFPEWVNTTEDGLKTLTIQGFEALAVEGMRELQSEIAGLREKNAELEARVERLESVESEVASLKAALATLIEQR